MAARFKIDQLSGAGAGVPNRSRWDLDDGEHIIFNVDQPVPGATYSWNLIDIAGEDASGSLSSPTGVTTQINAAGVQPPCAFVVRLTETLITGATSTKTLVACAMGPYPNPNLDGGLTQAEVYYMIMRVSGAGAGGAALSDEDPEDVDLDTEDPGVSEMGSRADHKHRLRHRWLKQGFTAAALDVPLLVASYYFEAGTLLAPARVFMGTDTGVDTATLTLARADNPSILATWTVTGVLQEDTIAAPVVCSAGWHQLVLVCSNPSVNAYLSGIDWLYVED